MKYPFLYETGEPVPIITLRDMFAAKAMQGFIVGCGFQRETADFGELSETAYMVADAMLKAREEK